MESLVYLKSLSRTQVKQEIRIGDRKGKGAMIPGKDVLPPR